MYVYYLLYIGFHSLYLSQMYTYTYIYAYICTEKERGREGEKIYTYVGNEREGEGEKRQEKREGKMALHKRRATCCTRDVQHAAQETCNMLQRAARGANKHD